MRLELERRRIAGVVGSRCSDGRRTRAGNRCTGMRTPPLPRPRHRPRPRNTASASLIRSSLSPALAHVPDNPYIDTVHVENNSMYFNRFVIVTNSKNKPIYTSIMRRFLFQNLRFADMGDFFFRPRGYFWKCLRCFYVHNEFLKLNY